MSNNKKNEQLGINFSTARNRLHKMILFHLAKRCNRDICFRCGKKIATVDGFSVDHKVPWQYQDNPKEQFFDLDNIAFSHPSCNQKASRCPMAATGAVKYKGVREKQDRRRKKKYDARIWNNQSGKMEVLGQFTTAENAARAYDRAAEISFGERAVTNHMLGLLD